MCLCDVYFYIWPPFTHAQTKKTLERCYRFKVKKLVKLEKKRLVKSFGSGDRLFSGSQIFPLKSVFFSFRFAVDCCQRLHLRNDGSTVCGILLWLFSCLFQVFSGFHFRITFHTRTM